MGVTLTSGAPGKVNQFDPGLVNGSNGTQFDGAGSVAAGVAGAVGAIPEALLAFSFTSIVESLDKLSPKMSSDDLEVALSEAEAKLKDTLNQTAISSINISSAAKKAALTQQQHELEDAQNKINEAASQNGDNDIWDKVKLAFQALGAVLMVAVGTLLCATGVGAALGGLMIAAGVVGLISTINSAIQMATGHGLLGEIVKACGGSDTQAGDADIAFAVGLAVVGIAMAIATGGAGAAEDLDAIAQAATSISEAVNGEISIASGVGDAVATGVSYEASTETADAKDDDAQAKDIQAFANQIDGFITMMIKHLAGMNKSFSNSLGSMMDALQDVNKTVSHAKLTA